MSKSVKNYLAEANAVIDTLAVHDAVALWSDPDTVFVDVREEIEAEKNGIIPGAIHAPRGFLEFIADSQGPMHKEEFASGKKLIVYCATGGRSALAARTLHDMGIPNACSLAGGFAAWKEANGPMEQ